MRSLHHAYNSLHTAARAAGSLAHSRRRHVLCEHVAPCQTCTTHVIHMPRRAHTPQMLKSVRTGSETHGARVTHATTHAMHGTCHSRHTHTVKNDPRLPVLTSRVQRLRAVYRQRPAAHRRRIFRAIDRNDRQCRCLLHCNRTTELCSVLPEARSHHRSRGSTEHLGCATKG